MSGRIFSLTTGIARPFSIMEKRAEGLPSEFAGDTAGELEV
jgi:hypothetical protein